MGKVGPLPEVISDIPDADSRNIQAVYSSWPVA